MLHLKQTVNRLLKMEHVIVMNTALVQGLYCDCYMIPNGIF